jgi:hypothetical protein
LGGALGFRGRWTTVMRHRGDAVAIRGYQRCRGGGGHGAGADARRLPCPHGVVTGKTAGRKGR